MSAAATGPSAGAAIGIMARLTLTRLTRGKLLWFIAMAAAIPVLVGFAWARAGTSPLRVARETLALVQFVFAILIPVLVGASVGNELGSKTATYLWSRPVPRWTILVAKLLVLSPLCAVLVAASWGGALATGHGLVSVQAIAAVAVDAVVASLVTAAMATIAPRFGIAFALGYLVLVDLPLAALPNAVAQLSIFHQTQVLADLPRELGEPPAESPVVAMIWLGAMSAIWLATAIRQLRDREV